jgi:acetolactate synthase-1/2/3 large subunit
MASPDSRVLAIVGDGGFQMSIPELQTIHEFRVPVTIVVLNNGMLGLMKNFQDENFDGLYPATVIGYSVPDVKKIARAYDLECYSLERDDKVDDALKWLGERRGPALLDVKVPAEWGPYPKVMPGSGLGKQRPALSEELEGAIEEALK